MTFNELIDIKPNVRVADIIQLFLLGYDDKIYLNLARFNNKGFSDYILKDERIIHNEWVKYYECKVKWIEENSSEYPELADLTLFID